MSLETSVLKVRTSTPDQKLRWNKISKRISLIYPIDEIQNSEKISEDERYLYQDKVWNDQLEAITVDKLKEIEMHRYKVEWHWTPFFEFFLYHVLFYIVLGPFMPLIFFRDPGMTLMRNMKFYGLNVTFYQQTFIWGGCIFNSVCYFIFPDNIITLTEIMFMWYAIIIRSVVIAAKYATFSREKLDVYYKWLLDDNTFDYDLMFLGWRTQTPEILFVEQYKCLKRFQFELTLYKFDFLVPIDEEIGNEITETKIDYIGDYTKYLCPLEANTYCGFKVFGYLVAQYQKQNPSSTFIKISILEAFIFSVTPLLYKSYYMSQNGLVTLDAIRVVYQILVSMFTFWGAYVFLHMGFYDFDRKFYLNEQCLYMIKSTNERYSSKKCLPTINVCNIDTLQAWSMLRSMATDYGQTFNCRTQGFFSIVFLGFVVLFAVLLLYILKFLDLTLFQMVILGELGLFITAFTAYYLYLGAMLNSFFQSYEVALQDLKSYYLDILRLKETYFINKIDPQNLIHKKCVKALMQQYNNDLEAITEVIDGIVNEIDDNIRLLSNDSRHNPFKLYGVKITLNLLKSVGVGLSTVLSYAMQQRFMIKS